MYGQDIPDSCPVCENRAVNEEFDDFRVGMPDGTTLVVPDILVWRCDRCGARWLGPVSSDAVDAYVRWRGKSTKGS